MKLFEITNNEIQQAVGPKIRLMTLFAERDPPQMWVKESQLIDLVYMMEPGGNIADYTVEVQGIQKELESMYIHAGGEYGAYGSENRESINEFVSYMKKHPPTYVVLWGAEDDQEMSAVYTNLSNESVSMIANVMMKVRADQFDPDDITLTNKYIKVGGKKHYFK